MTQISPRSLARTAGALYLINIIGGAFAIGVVPGMLFVAGDPAATAHNIASHELLYRLGIAAHVVIVMTNVAMAVIFYELFKVVDRRLALLMAFFTLVATAIESAALLNQFTPLMVLRDNSYANTITAGQGQALAYYLPFQSAAAGYDVSSVFYAGFDLAIGFLILRSTFFPRVIGLLMAIDGIGHLLYSFADIVAPGFAARLVPWAQLPILIGEGSLCLWLLFAGVNGRRWSQQADAVGPALMAV